MASGEGPVATRFESFHAQWVGQLFWAEIGELERFGPEVTKRCHQPLEVGPTRLWHDVEVFRTSYYAVGLERETADEHELHIVFAECPQQRQRVERLRLAPAHRPPKPAQPNA